MITKESLGIFWDYGNGQEEADGLILYGWWRKKLPEELSIDVFEKIWAAIDVQFQVRRWETEEYNSLSIEILIVTWPNTNEEWNVMIRQALKWFTNNGAAISWCGDEYSSPDPRIFAPGNSVGSLYAAWMPKIGMACNASLSDEFEYLSEKQLLLYNSELIAKSDESCNAAT